MSGFGVVLGQYVRRALAYRWLVTVPTVLVFALVTLYVMMQPDTFESHAVLMAPMTQPADASARRETEDMQRVTLQSATERMLSSTMLLKVIDDVNPYPVFRQKEGTDAAVEKLRNRLRVDINPRSGVITVYCTHSEGKNPAEKAAAIVNSLTNTLLEHIRTELQDSKNFGKSFNRTEKKRLAEERDRAQQAMDEFQIKWRGSLPDDVALNRDEIQTLNQNLLVRRTEKRQFAFNIQELERSNMHLETELALLSRGANASNDTLLSGIISQINSLKLEKARLAEKFDDDHRFIAEKRVQIAEVERQLKIARENSVDEESIEKQSTLIRFIIDGNKARITESRKELVLMDEEIAKDQAKIGEVRNRIVAAAKLGTEYLSLQNNVDEATTKYDEIILAYEKAVKDDRFWQYAGKLPIEIEQTAFVPAKPAGPHRLMTSLIGLALGLGIGVGLAVAMSRLDKSYQRPEDLRALLPGAVLVTIPEVQSTGARVSSTIFGIIGGLILMAVFVATVTALGVQVGWWADPTPTGLFDQLTKLR